MKNTHQRVCPWWLGYILVNPLRRFFENPSKILGPYIREGMTVLELGPGMGYFTKEIARLVGSSGRVLAVDIQSKMLAGLRRRLKRAGLLERADLRLAGPDSIGIEDLEEKVDFAVLFHVVHEVPDQSRLFRDLFAGLKPGSKVLMAEPKRHVAESDFEQSLREAAAVGFRIESRPNIGSNLAALFLKP